MPSPSETGRAGWARAVVAAVGLGLLPGPAVGDDRHPGGVSLGGTTGLVHVPTAEVMSDRSVRFGFGFVGEKWAYVGRGQMNNEMYFLAIGFLPRLELAVRATVLPGIDLLEGRDAPAVDRMASARFRIREGRRGPAIAVGIDDVRGTRLYHALYVTATQPVRVRERVAVRLTGGWGSTALDARNRTLAGVFGGAEIPLWNSSRSRASFLIDWDTEKVNSGVRLTLFDRVSLHVALLHLETLSGGVGWTESL